MRRRQIQPPPHFCDGLLICCPPARIARSFRVLKTPRIPSCRMHQLEDATALSRREFAITFCFAARTCLDCCFVATRRATSEAGLSVKGWDIALRRFVCAWAPLRQKNSTAERNWTAGWPKILLLRSAPSETGKNSHPSVPSIIDLGRGLQRRGQQVSLV